MIIKSDQYKESVLLAKVAIQKSIKTLQMCSHKFTVYYNETEISISARGKFQSKTNIFHGFTTVQYSWRVY